MRKVLLIIMLCIPYAQAEELPPPASISIEGDVLTWDAVEGAIGYNVYLGATRFTTRYFTTVRDTRQYRVDQPGTYQVIAFDESGNFGVHQGANPAVEYVPVTAPVEELPPPASITIEGDVLSWDAVEGAIGYNVYLGATRFTTRYFTTVRDTRQYRVDQPGTYQVIAFDESGNFGVHQGANPAVEYVPVTAPVEELPPPASITIEGDVLSWDAVEGAIGYNVYLGATRFTTRYFTTVRDSRQYRVDQPGTYQVIAFDESGNFGVHQGANPAVEYIVE